MDEIVELSVGATYALDDKEHVQQVENETAELYSCVCSGMQYSMWDSKP